MTKINEEPTELDKMIEVWEKYFAKHMDESSDYEIIFNPDAGVPPSNIRDIDMNSINITLWPEFLIKRINWLNDTQKSDTFVFRQLKLLKTLDLKHEYVRIECYHYRGI